MKTLKFLRNVAVYGIHREQGSVHQIEDKESILLIADGVAMLTKPEIETAALKPAKETAAKR
jgi:hypothetical protein